jgi:hypothetical protein
MMAYIYGFDVFIFRGTLHIFHYRRLDMHNRYSHMHVTLILGISACFAMGLIVGFLIELGFSREARVDGAVYFRLNL